MSDNQQKPDQAPSGLITSTGDLSLPVLALKDEVLTQNFKATVMVGRAQSVAALQKAKEEGGLVFTVLQKNSDQDSPGQDDLHMTGMVANIVEMIETPEGPIKVTLEGAYPATINNFTDNGTFCEVNADAVVSNEGDPQELAVLVEMVRKEFTVFAKAQGLSQGFMNVFAQAQSNEELAAVVSAAFLADFKTKQDLLDTHDLNARFTKMLEGFAGAQQKLEIKQGISAQVKEAVEKNQREFILREQAKAIQKELGEDTEDEMEQIEARIAAINFPDDIRAKAVKEFKRIKQMNPQSPEYSMVRNYLDVLMDVPWNKPGDVNYDTQAARARMDEDHYGMDKIKEQILEHLAVQRRLIEKDMVSEGSPKIICLVGPPGVGKTSIAKSLAEATGREYIRMALGGVRDEAQIRGFRRTYMGAKPGKIIQSLIDGETSNPLFVLDEIDKMGSDQRGDPASAMLEVLDPEQNKAFEDHYLDVPYDLSDVMFIATANVWGNIPGPLQDRMETIFLGSYTPEEKLEIATRHLVRKQMKANGLGADEFSVEQNALETVISGYTSESGVRELQRQIGRLCTKAAVRMEGSDVQSFNVTKDMLEDLLGPIKYTYDKADLEDRVGFVSGLAYTAVGGQTLAIEAVKLPSKTARIEVTGNIAKVMQESVNYAHKYMWANAASLGLDLEKDIDQSYYHVHCPEAAVPKDGPSAGAAMLTAIFSAASGKPVNGKVAMTGEINLKGNVTAIGGLREKLAAAARAGYTTVLIPKQNEKDLDEVPDQIKDKLTIIPVGHVDEVLKHAIVGFEKPSADASTPEKPKTFGQKVGAMIDRAYSFPHVPS